MSNHFEKIEIKKAESTKGGFSWCVLIGPYILIAAGSLGG